MQWGYRNDTDKSIHLFDYDGAGAFASKAYIVDPANNAKGKVAEISPQSSDTQHKSKSGDDKKELLISPIEARDLSPGDAVVYWAKFPPPAESAKELSLYLPNSPPLEDLPIGQAPTNAPQGDALAATTQPNGLQVSVTRVRRSSDGTVEVRWRYTNTSEKRLEVLNFDTAKQLPVRLFVVDPDAKIEYPVATDAAGAPLMAEKGPVALEAGQTDDAWAKFLVSKDAKRLSVYVPGAMPMEDLPIQQKK